MRDDSLPTAGDLPRGAAAGDLAHRFSAAVIGLGRIGQGYDYSIGDDSLIVTHASGFTHHRGYDLIAGVDPDPVQRERFQMKSGRPAYGDVAAMMAVSRPDVCSIGVPTAEHFRVFEELMRVRPRAVVCEKPIASRLADAQAMTARAEEQGCALVVNYMRRFEPGVLNLRRAVRAGALGRIVKGIVWYGKGLLHNGSHFVDLLRFLLGEVTDMRVVARGRDWLGQDAEPDVCLRFGEVPVYFLASREGTLVINEMTLLGTDGAVRYTGGGVIELRATCPDPVDPSTLVLAEDAGRIPSDLGRYQWHVLDALYRHLTENAPLNSDGRSATETLAVIEDVLELRKRWT